MYLGAMLSKMQLEDGNKLCIISDGNYVNIEAKNIEDSPAMDEIRLPSKCVTQFSIKYYQQLENSPELKVDGVERFQDIIIHIFWSVEIGLVDILLETSFLSSNLSMPRIDHLQQALHIFGYLNIHLNIKLGFDPEHPAVNENRFGDCDWSEFYGDASEEIPSNKPVPKGN